MNGHQPILAMRRARRKPAYIWVEDHPKVLLDGLTVSTHGDVPELLDLRFLLGVTALVSSGSAERAERLFEACRPLARRVIASVVEGRHVTRVIDSQGELTWPR